MIDAADGGYTELTRYSSPVAAIPHRCGDCGRTIDPGERYQRATGLYDGRWWTSKQCAQCSAAARWLTLVCGGWLWEGVAEDLGEHWAEVDPRSVALGRLVIGIGRQWRRPTGGRYSPAEVHAWAIEGADRYDIAVARWEARRDIRAELHRIEQRRRLAAA